MRSPAHHDGSPLYVSDARPHPGDLITVRIRVDAALGATEVHVRTVRDGEPHFVAAHPLGSDGHEDWFEAAVEVWNEQLVYRFLVRHRGGYGWLSARGWFERDISDVGDFRITTGPQAPAWASGAVVYEIFPDRFASSHAPRDLPAWARPTPWGQAPAVRGDVTGLQYYGGDLEGITQHLDYVKALGAGAVYLTPFFPARSVHRYDATTFDHVDPLLGGDEALAALTAAAHRLGIRVIGDLTMNHTGVGHEWFRRAVEDPGSPEHGYYYWTPGEPGYAGWFDVPSLPKLNYSAPTLLERMAGPGPGAGGTRAGEDSAGGDSAGSDSAGGHSAGGHSAGGDSVVAHWLRAPFSLDGWRIDVANMTGRFGGEDHAHEVARAVRATLARERPDGVLVAEHGHDASTDLQGGGWDATMNYSGFTRPLWTWLTRPDSDLQFLGQPTRIPRRGGAGVAETMREFASLVPWTVTAAQWNLLDSHDTPRLRTVTGSDPLVEVGAAALLTLPGTAVIFAGAELGATGETGEAGRRTMPWGHPQRWDTPTFHAYRSLIAARNGSSALREGGMRWLFAEDDAMGYLRESPDERVLVVLARAPWSGARLPRHLLAPGEQPELLHGTLGLRVSSCLEVSGDGPGVGVWRLA